MRALFVHNNFPAQFVHLAPALTARGWDVRAIGSPTASALPGIPLHHYHITKGTTPGIFPLAIRFEADCIRGTAVAEVAAALNAKGYVPDLILGHVGWGETLSLPEIWPEARTLIYAELFVRSQGLDFGFDPEFPAGNLGNAMRVRAKNAGVLMALIQADRGLAPTAFQRDTFPAALRERIAVCHDGIDTDEVRPRKDARFTLPDGTVLTAADEVITNLNRNLEPLRGLHVLLRALPEILARRPRARVVIVGQDNPQPYGTAPPKGSSWREHYLAELSRQLDLSRVHFTGRLERADYLALLAVSRVHVYLSYPFVLSWSLIEAMSSGCLIVAADTQAVSEVIRDGENGRIIDFFDRPALVEAVTEALAAPERFAALRERARADAVARYDLRSVCLPRLVALAEETARLPRPASAP